MDITDEIVTTIVTFYNDITEQERINHKLPLSGKIFYTMEPFRHWYFGTCDNCSKEFQGMEAINYIFKIYKQTEKNEIVKHNKQNVCERCLSAFKKVLDEY